MSLYDIVLRTVRILFKTSATTTTVFSVDVVSPLSAWGLILMATSENLFSFVFFEASANLFWYAGQPRKTVAWAPPPFEHLVFYFATVNSFTLWSCQQRRDRLTLLLSLAESPSFRYLKQCFTCGGIRVASHRYSCQSTLTPGFWTAFTWLFDFVITRINFVGWPVAQLVICETFVTFIALLYKSSSFTSYSVMLWWTFTMTKLGLVLGLGSVFLAITLAFRKTWFRFSDIIRHSLEARSSGWIKKSVLYFSSLTCFILTARKFDLIPLANWTIKGLRYWLGLSLVFWSAFFYSTLQ